MPRLLQAFQAVVKRPPVVETPPLPPPPALSYQLISAVLSSAASSAGRGLDRAKDFVLSRVLDPARAFVAGLEDEGRRSECAFAACVVCIMVAVTLAIVFTGRHERKEAATYKSPLARVSSGGGTVATTASSDGGSSLGSICESEEEAEKEAAEEEKAEPEEEVKNEPEQEEDAKNEPEPEHKAKKHPTGNAAPKTPRREARRMSVPYKKANAQIPEGLVAERANYIEFLHFLHTPSKRDLAAPAGGAASRRATVSGATIGKTDEQMAWEGTSLTRVVAR